MNNYPISKELLSSFMDGFFGYGNNGAARFSGVNDGNPYIFAQKFGGTSVTPYKNGTAGTAITYTPPAWTALDLDIGSAGGGSYFIGRIYEVLIYDTALSDGDRGDVETYLIDKYGIV